MGCHLVQTCPMEAELGRVVVNVLCVFLAIGADVFQNNQHELEAEKNRFAPALLANPFKTCGWSDDPIWGIGCTDKEPLSPHSQAGVDEPHAGDDGIVSVHRKPKLLSIAGLSLLVPSDSLGCLRMRFLIESRTCRGRCEKTLSCGDPGEILAQVLAWRSCRCHVYDRSLLAMKI